MTCDASLFSIVDTCIQFPHVYFTDGTLRITHCGTITSVTHPVVRLAMTTVFVEPSICLNLIFTDCLCVLGQTMSFSFVACVVQDLHTDRTVGVGSRRNLYELNYLHVSYVAAQDSSVFVCFLCVYYRDVA